MPPSLLYLKVGRFGVWLPLILLWPVLLLLGLLLQVASLTTALVLLPRKGTAWSKAMAAVVPNLCWVLVRTRGFRVEIQAADGHEVVVKLW